MEAHNRFTPKNSRGRKLSYETLKHIKNLTRAGEWTAVFEEQLALPREEADEVIRFVFDRPYAFMFPDIGTSELYKNFDRTSISDDKDQHQDSYMV
jgi:hypothetical protein